MEAVLNTQIIKVCLVLGCPTALSVRKDGQKCQLTETLQLLRLDCAK
jgi:hypothetical protein